MSQSHIMNVLPKRLIANFWASQETRISLSHLATPSKQKKLPLATASSFLCNELPVRYTHILRLLSSLNTDTLQQSPLIKDVCHRYLHDICTMLHPSLKETSPKAFSNTIQKLRQRQASSLIKLRYALTSSSTATSQSVMLMDHINAIGLGIHYLLDQHLSWHQKTGNHAQVICPVDIAHQAVEDAKQTCIDTFGDDRLPTIHIKKNKSAHQLELTQVPSVLHRILYEATLISLRSHFDQPPTVNGNNSKSWIPSIFKRKNNNGTSPFLQLDVFGGPTSVGYRLTNSAALTPHDLQHDIPRDMMGVPTCASILRQSIHQQHNNSQRYQRSAAKSNQLDEYEDVEQNEWSMWSGWRMAKTMAGHFGGHLDIVSAEGLGSTMYLALDRDDHILERYPSILPSRSNSHQRYASSHLSIHHANSQLDAFLYAISDNDHHHHQNDQAAYSSANHHHAVSLTAAVGHA
ncbi:hypothetical protein BJ944DRAFT_244916 [Cunninghamella echinulata]|nr:hypothetical protein BJ944DRAFT_244916 [Cunninghamella echinulata]